MIENRKDYLLYPTISELNLLEKEEYLSSNVNVKDLLKKIEMLELGMKVLEQRLSVLEKKQEIYQSEPINSELQEKQEKESINSELQEKIEKKPTDSINTENIKVGDIIKLGKLDYREIEWQVLEINKTDNSALLLSKYLLFKKSYSVNRKNCTWEKSTLRKYLNTDFLIYSFSTNENKKIKEMDIENLDNITYGSKGGNNTRDKIFILDRDEILKYFKTDDERKASYMHGNQSNYWLRYPGAYNHRTAFATVNGTLFEYGYFPDDNSIGVRPALWIYL